MKNEIRETENAIASKEYYKLEKELVKTERKIQKGLAKETASTGTPINVLHGAAKFVSQLSNIGGGSKEIGGGGIEDGFNTINKNTAIKARMSAIESQEKVLIDVEEDSEVE